MENLRTAVRECVRFLIPCRERRRTIAPLPTRRLAPAIVTIESAPVFGVLLREVGRRSLAGPPSYSALLRRILGGDRGSVLTCGGPGQDRKRGVCEALQSLRVHAGLPDRFHPAEHRQQQRR
jgi:hypothetical protein